MSGYRSTKTCSIQLQGSPEQLFPLLCPVREYEWIDSWQCEVIYSNAGVAELDCVFKTNFPGDGPEDTWVVSRYEPPLLIEFVRINTLRTIRFNLSLKRNDDGTTSLVWTQIFTGLTSQGDELIRDLTDEIYRERVALRERQINYFLSTGQMLRTD
jgi:hypothetical protein